MKSRNRKVTHTQWVLKSPPHLVFIRGGDAQLELKFIGIIKKLFFGWIILIPIWLGPAHELVNLNIFLHILESKIDKEKVNECNRSHIKVINPDPYIN